MKRVFILAIVFCYALIPLSSFSAARVPTETQTVTKAGETADVTQTKKKKAYVHPTIPKDRPYGATPAVTGPILRVPTVRVPAAAFPS